MFLWVVVDKVCNVACKSFEIFTIHLSGKEHVAQVSILVFERQKQLSGFFGPFHFSDSKQVGAEAELEIVG